MSTKGLKLHMYTKDEINKVLDLWETMSTEQICDETGLTKTQISYISMIIRQSGYKLPRKHVRKSQHTLIKEVLLERGLIKTA